jgi:RNA polymerase primary sigma factor
MFTKYLDLKHPEMAIFPFNHALLPAETKQQIYQEYRSRESVEGLARRFGQTLPCIRRIINEVCAVRIRELPLGYMDNEQFPCLRAEIMASEILTPPPENTLRGSCETISRQNGTSRQTKPHLPRGLPAYLAGLYEVPLLSRDQEVHLFRKMNYLKYHASKLREQFDLHRPNRRLMDRIESLFAESVAIKNQIISANLRLVVSIAKRHISPAEDFFELVSDGNLTLIRAVEKFDFSLGNRFSTYATWAIMKNFARSIPAVLRQRDRFSTSHSDIFDAIEDLHTDPREQELAQRQCESQVKKILGCLDERELQIVAGRFGLTGGQPPLTLMQIGAVIGVSKERVRQIQIRAMGKLRKAAAEDITNTASVE